MCVVLHLACRPGSSIGWYLDCSPRAWTRPIDRTVVLSLRAPSPPAALAVTAPDVYRRHAAALGIATAAVLLVALAAPFEIPLVTLAWPPLVVTSVEVALLMALGAGLALYVVHPRAFVWRTPITWPGLALAGAFFLAAAIAPGDSGNALRFAARFASAGLLFLLVVNTVGTDAAARRLAYVLLAVGAFVGVVAALELAEVASVMQALTWFRPGFHVVGGQLRASSTLGYPTTTSMYLEVAFAWGLWLLVAASAAGERRRTAVAFAALVLIAVGIVATFTRAGLIGMAVSLAIVGGLRFARTRRFDRAHLALGVLAVAIVASIFLLRSPAGLLARWSTEGSQAWYGAQYDVPERLQFVPGGRYRVPVGVTNTGRVPWRSDETPPFALSYHWVVAGSSRVVEFNGRRTGFVGSVEPGEHAVLKARVIAPGLPGWYELVWDVVHEHRTWLSTEGVRPARTIVHVDGPLARMSGDDMAELPPAASRPDRPTLWRAALAIAAAHPVLGVGPDNFRLTYGPYLGLETWDRRVHANNLYLEVLSGAGLVGLVALLWVIAAAGLALWRRWRAAPPKRATALAAALAVWAAVAGHGLVDSFLSFTPTYVTFALAAGLAFSPALSEPLPTRRGSDSPSAPSAPPAAHAHRV